MRRAGDELCLGSRFVVTACLAQHGPRLTLGGRDKLTRKDVILKTDTPPAALRELRTLLSLPPGVGPAVQDACWARGGRLILVLERLPGPTLLESTAKLTTDSLPQHVHSISQCLIHLHRARLVHADLKPAHIVLPTDRRTGGARLLDFGCARDDLGTLWGKDEDNACGTLPYAAPEITSGWLVDGRADQFSLGMTLRDVFPGLGRDPLWASILARLTARIPCQRYPNMTALRNELAQHFGLAETENRFPPFGGGPIRGRESQLRQVVELVLSGRVRGVLVQTLPGLGLTRFLSEALGRIAERHGPPTRLLDLPALKAVRGDDAGLGYLEECQSAGEVVLCGITDPSPGLRWRRIPRIERWIPELTGPGWARLALPPLDQALLGDMVAHCLGSQAPSVAHLACSLHSRTDGNLRAVSVGLRRVLRDCAREDGCGWVLDARKVSRVLYTWDPGAEGIRLPSIPKGLAEPLRVTARVGFRMSHENAQSVLERFCAPGSLERLLDHGYLQRDGDGQITFLTRQLWQESAAGHSARAADVEAWLHRKMVPDPSSPEQVVRACERARRLGDSASESAWLGQALAVAHDQRQYEHVQALFAYPGKVPEEWTAESIVRHAHILRERLGPEWSQERVVLAVANSLWGADPALVERLLGVVVKGPDSVAAAEALMLLLDVALHRNDGKLYRRYLEALARLERENSAAVHPGITDGFRARRALFLGRGQEAETWASRAATPLRGSGALHEVLNMQVLAFTRSARDPRGAIRILRRALKTTAIPAQRAQVSANLSSTLEDQGNLRAALACVENALAESRATLTRDRVFGLRVRRASIWAWLDRCDQAIAEVRDLLQYAAVRERALVYVDARLVLGYCLYHRFSNRTALREVVRAWEEAQERTYSEEVAKSLSLLIDVLLDQGAWDTVKESGQGLEQSRLGTDPVARAVRARTVALRLQAEGRLDEALARLQRCSVDRLPLSDRVESARYWHQRGVVYLSRRAVRQGTRDSHRAAAAFRTELRILGGHGYAYYRARALLALGFAVLGVDGPSGAIPLFTQAVSLARRIRSLGLLARCLEARSMTVGGMRNRPEPAPAWARRR